MPLAKFLFAHFFLTCINATVSIIQLAKFQHLVAEISLWHFFFFLAYFPHHFVGKKTSLVFVGCQFIDHIFIKTSIYLKKMSISHFYIGGFRLFCRISHCYTWWLRKHQSCSSPRWSRLKRARGLRSTLPGAKTNPRPSWPGAMCYCLGDWGYKHRHVWSYMIIYDHKWSYMYICDHIYICVYVIV